MDKETKAVAAALGISAGVRTEEEIRTSIRLNAEMIQQLAGKAEAADSDWTGEIEHHLNSMKKDWSDLEEIEGKRKTEQDQEEERQDIIDDIIRYSGGAKTEAELSSLSEDELWVMYEEEQTKWLDTE